MLAKDFVGALPCAPRTPSSTTSRGESRFCARATVAAGSGERRWIALSPRKAALQEQMRPHVLLLPEAPAALGADMRGEISNPVLHALVMVQVEAPAVASVADFAKKEPRHWTRLARIWRLLWRLHY